LPADLHGGHVGAGTDINFSGEVRSAAQIQRQAAVIVFGKAIDAADPQIRGIGERQINHAILDPQIGSRVDGPEDAKKTADGGAEVIL
jgi:hypothetical protein